MKKYIWAVVLFWMCIWTNGAVSAWFQTILIDSSENKIENVIQYNNQKTEIKGDLELYKNIYGSKKLIVHGDLKILWKGEVFMNDIVVYGDVYISDKVKIYWTLSANNIEANNYISIWKLEIQGNAKFWTHLKITRGVNVWWDFESGSRAVLSWTSLVEWNMKVWANTNISGVLYVNKNFEWNYYFNFDGQKIRILWNFKVNKYSKVRGRIYMYAGTWHRYLHGFWHEIYKYRYEVKNRQYSNKMKVIDPALDFRLSQWEVNKISSVVSHYESKIRAQQKYIEKLYSQWKKYKIIHSELLKLKQIHEWLFSYVSFYIWSTSWDKVYFKNTEVESYNQLKVFIYKYGSGLDFE